jgi:methionyl aminopeptidase
MTGRTAHRTAAEGYAAPGPTIKSPRELEAMRAAGRVVGLTIRKVLESLHPGVTTGELDRIAHREIKALGAKPSFLGYPGNPAYAPYPAVICVSINDEIVHGIPGNRVVRDGDIVSIDAGAVVDGFHGDSAVTVVAGTGSKQAAELIESAREALARGIAAARAGNRTGDISNAVESYVRPKGYELVREYVGHGIGRKLHEPPQVPNFGPAGQGPVLRHGMTIAIEPMLNIGGWETKVLGDGWTVVTADGKPSAHFEHTVAVLDSGPEVLTA